MNLLTLKTIIYDAKEKKFISPSHKGFSWSPGIIGRECSKGCTIDHFNPECTCGIYGSPNPEALDEYAQYDNSVFVLMNTYGWVDVWSAPADVGYAYVTRSWGVRIIGVVATGFNGKPLSGARQLSSIKITDVFGVKGYSWFMAKEMIKTTWKRENERNPEFKVWDPYAVHLWMDLDNEAI